MSSPSNLQIAYLLTSLAVPAIVIGWLCCLCYCVVKHIVAQEQQLKTREGGSVVVIVGESSVQPAVLFKQTNRSLQIQSQIEMSSPTPSLLPATTHSNGFTSIPGTRPGTRPGSIPGTRPGTRPGTHLISGQENSHPSQMGPSAPTLEPLPMSPRSRPMLPTPPKAKSLWTPLPPIQGAAQRKESGKKSENYIPFFSLLPNQGSFFGHSARRQPD